MHLAFNLLYLLGFLVASPWLVYCLLRGRPRPWGPPGVAVDVGPGALWLHGSSVGEVSLLGPFVALVEQRWPDLEIVISSHTSTGVEAARRACPRATVFRFPVDFSWSQRRLMRALAPSLVVVVESDLWPNHLLAARRYGVPVAVINAKLSEKSFRLHRLTRLVPSAMSSIALIAAQTESHADRFRRLGMRPERIHVTGNMKYDLTGPDDSLSNRASLRRRLGFDDSEIVIIGGSLHTQEDVDLLAAYAATRAGSSPTRLIIVPRYPDAARAVVDNCKAAGFAAVLKSELDHGGAGTGAADRVVVVDTLGELRQLYAAADIAFVGGSLYFRGANKGGHNLMEPAILGLPVVFGPHNFSFRETVADLLASEAGIEVSDRSGLGRALVELAASAELRSTIGQQARQVVLERQGASARNLDLIAPIVESSPACR